MVEFTLTKEQQLAQKLFRDFAENEIRPLAREMDETEEYNMELLEKMKKLGFFGIQYPKELGGEGADTLTYTLCMEEVSKVDASTGITISVHASLGCMLLEKYGTEYQKEAFLRPLIDGRKVSCIALTEPSAGTDASAIKTTAVRDGDHYILNGQKVFITNSGFADIFFIFALTDRAAGGVKGMSLFVLEKGMSGLEVSKNIPRMGIRAAQNCEVTMIDVKVPAENLVGVENKGYKLAMEAFGSGRIGIGAQAVGIAQGALNEVIKYTKERKQFGKTIASFQNTQFKIAEMQTKIDAARFLVWRAAKAKDNHEDYASYAAMCKLFASDVAVQITRDCVQLMGGYGYSREYPVERMYRDAKITEIYEGTSEAMRMIVAGKILK
ncbi:MAG: acyl-CoA dehydrogenase family protein [Firmicutes bacterium]|nr:acyl-CoA dehydrogenase family protein [Bacillota bacterium]